LEVLRGEKELNVIATENELAPNQIRNWKAEFLKNATAAFEDKRTEELRCELQSKHQETEELYKKIGQLTTQVDWLKKNLNSCLDLNGKVNLLRAQKAESGKGNLTIQTMAQLLEVNRTSISWMPARPTWIPGDS